MTGLRRSALATMVLASCTSSPSPPASGHVVVDGVSVEMNAANAVTVWDDLGTGTIELQLHASDQTPYVLGVQWGAAGTTIAVSNTATNAILTVGSGATATNVVVGTWPSSFGGVSHPVVGFSGDVSGVLKFDEFPSSPTILGGGAVDGTLELALSWQDADAKAHSASADLAFDTTLTSVPQ